MKNKITFIAERMPQPNSSGAESYNYYICQLLVKAGYDINIIVTGDYFSTPWFLADSIDASLFNKVNLIRYKSIAGLTVSSSIKSYLRPVKQLLNTVSKKKRERTSNNVLKIGRFITFKEANSCLNLIDESSHLLLIDTIFRYHKVFNKVAFKKALVVHDVFFSRTQSFNQQGLKVFPEISVNIERSLWQQFDLHIAINEDERQVIATSCDRPVCTVFPQYKEMSFTKTSSAKDRQNILYIGANAHHNIHGLQLFLDNIWPAVIASCPNAKLNVVGSIAASFEGVNIQGVKFLGRVDNLASIAEKCDFSINPVYMGSGVKIKILDYLSFELPCITTSVGLMGFARQSSMPIVEAIDNEDFTVKLINWLINEQELLEVSASIKEYVALFSADKGVETIAMEIKKVMDDGN